MIDPPAHQHNDHIAVKYHLKETWELKYAPTTTAPPHFRSVLMQLLTLLHSEGPKLHRVLALLSAVGLNFAL